MNTDQKPATVWDHYAEKIMSIGDAALRGRHGSLAKCIREQATEIQMLRAKCGLPQLSAAEDEAQRLARWLREYPLTPGATTTAPAAPRPAPASVTPTWDKFQALPEKEKTAFFMAHREQIAAEQRAVAAKGGHK